MSIKPVSDLYLITYEDGITYKSTRDAKEAVDAIESGFKVEEFVSLENHRAAMLQSFGNSEQLNEIGSWNNHKNTPTAKPAFDTCELIKQVEGMEVSVDVSTCDADAGHRYFGTVTEVSELDTAKNGYILLVQDAEPNFDVNGNSPVIPDGYALVPIEPTHAMINAWLSEVANWRGHVAGYKAMLAAAPQQEVQSQVQEQRVAIREEMAMGSRLTNHRFRVK